MKYSNESNISLPMAVFLAVDKYDHDARDNVISATTLMKSTRQIILSMRAEAGDSVQDISTLLASRLGTAIHESVEDAWKNHYVQALLDLGQPKRVVDAVRINPEEPDPDTIPIYLEIRSEKLMGKWIVSGCADLIFNGMIQDLKSTGVFAYMTGANDKKYQLQLSIYRWLNQDKVTEDRGSVQFIFKDWKKLDSQIQQGYPALPILEKPFDLLSVPVTNNYVVEKLAAVDKHMLTPEAELPLCSDEDLWIRASEWKYYSKVDAKRATKNFREDKASAYALMAQKGIGIVKEVKGKAGACSWCNSRQRCSQYAALVKAGQA